MGKTYLDLISETNSVPYPWQSSYKSTVVDQSHVFLSHDGTPIGRIVNAVVAAIKEDQEDAQNFLIDPVSRTVQISPALSTFESRNSVLASLAEKWRSQSRFAILKGWRNELYTVFNPSHTPYFLIERAAAALFGVATYGVHIVGYIPANEATGQPLRIWVPRRSPTKPTFPNMLDNMVAGGLGYPHGVYETAVKECAEEAGLSEAYVQARLRPVGVVTYMYRHQYEDNNSHVEALFQPEIEYLYDIEMDEDTIPQPTDDEVAEFHLMTVEEVKAELFAGSFKPNTALVQIDFFIRHGIITSENEPTYINILSQTHRQLEYPIR